MDSWRRVPIWDRVVMPALSRESKTTFTNRALSWGESYRESLLANVRKFSRILQPQLNGEILEAMTKSLDVDKLRELENVYGRLAAEKVPMSLQTAGKRNVPAANANGDFTI